MLMGTYCSIRSSNLVGTCFIRSSSNGRTTQRLEDRVKQHVPTRLEDRIEQYVPMSIRKKTHIEREQPPRGCKTRNAQNKCDLAIGQHLLENPECAKMYNDDKVRIIGQARSSFHLGVLESVYIQTQNPLLCRQKEFVFSLGLFHQEKGDSALIGHKSN